VPLGGGMQRNRILSEERPHADAERVAPTLEDGYLRLVGLGVEI